MRVNIFSFHLCLEKLILIYYVYILILVYIFSFLFKILFNFSIYFFLVWPLYARHVNSETLTCNLAYFTNITRRNPLLSCLLSTWWVPVSPTQWRNVMPVSQIPLAKCHVVPATSCFAYSNDRKLWKTDPFDNYFQNRPSSEKSL